MRSVERPPASVRRTRSRGVADRVHHRYSRGRGACLRVSDPCKGRCQGAHGLPVSSATDRRGVPVCEAASATRLVPCGRDARLHSADRDRAPDICAPADENQSVPRRAEAIAECPKRVEACGVDQRDLVEVDDEVIARDVAPFHHVSKRSDGVRVEGARRRQSHGCGVPANGHGELGERPIRTGRRVARDGEGAGAHVRSP